MFDNVNWLIPTVPDGYNQWAKLIVVFISGVMLLYRGRVMHDHATRIDFFGWSVIIFDTVFGGSMVISSFWRLYPATHTAWIDWIVILSVAMVVTWELIMVRRASHDRIDRALSPDPPRNERGDPIVRDRRRHHRRTEDRMLRARIAELEKQQ